MACGYRTAFEAERTLFTYDGMRIEALNKKWLQMTKAVSELENHAAETAADNLRLREEFRSVKAENDALKERQRVCSDTYARERPSYSANNKGYVRALRYP